eukprot:IDg4208t1
MPQPTSTNSHDLESNIPTSLSAALKVNDLPQSYAEAASPANNDFWSLGIKREEDTIRKNNTFTFVKYQPEMHVILCKYVFKVKYHLPKVRIFAKGFRQDLECDQIDVMTAFLNGDLKEDIYVQILPRFEDDSK